MKVDIYQAKDTFKGIFMPLSYLQDKGIDIDISQYNKVYSCNVDDDFSAEDIYRKFNLDIPDDFTGHSLSVSDVFIIDDNYDVAYYCDRIGFKELSNFFDTNYYKEVNEEQKDTLVQNGFDNFVDKDNSYIFKFRTSDKDKVNSLIQPQKNIHK